MAVTQSSLTVAVAREPFNEDRGHRNERVREALRLVHEHLNAAMIMVPLETPVDASTSVDDALAYLEMNGFDLALLDDREVRLVYRDDLRRVPPERRDSRAMRYSASARADRLVEHTLDLGEVAERLIGDRTPLLVVGRQGPEYIVAQADFTRPAGQAGILAVIAVLDAELDAFVGVHDREVWPLLPSKRRRAIETLAQRARRRDAEVPRLGYLTLAERLAAIRRLRLDRRYGIQLGTQSEHELVVAVRNDVSHGREVRDGLAAMKALVHAENYLDRLGTVSLDTFWSGFAAVDYVRSLTGVVLRTLTGRPNRILTVDCSGALVATSRSPDGRHVPLEVIAGAIERLTDERELEIDVRSVGYRSAFIGAVLLTLPGAFVDVEHPRLIRLEPPSASSADSPS